MNIFILSNTPKECAKQMLDKHVVKMPTESMQMISTILHHHGIDSPYKPVMLNHPCTIWARKSKQNFSFLWNHCYELCKEYTIRYGKTHKVEETLKEYDYQITKTYDLLPDIGRTPFAQAMPDKYKNEDAVKAYREYYLNEKYTFATWKTQEPDWWPDNHYNNMIDLRKKQFQDKMRRNKYAI